MEKVKRFIRNFNEKRSYQIVFFVVSMCVILGLYVGISFRIAYKDVTTIVEDKSLIKHIDEMKEIDGKIVISGWCLYNGADSKKYKIQMFLRNINDEKDIVWLDVKETTRADVDSYFDCEVDYNQTGFEASKDLEKLDLIGKNYEVVLVLKYSTNNVVDIRGKKKIIESKNIKTVSTKHYLTNGIVSMYKNEESKPIQTASEEINRVFKEGQLLTYKADCDIYIYQYNAKKC